MHDEKDVLRLPPFFSFLLVYSKFHTILHKDYPPQFLVNYVRGEHPHVLEMCKILSECAVDEGRKHDDLWWGPWGIRPHGGQRLQATRLYA